MSSGNKDVFHQLRMMTAGFREVYECLEDIAPFVDQMNLCIDLSSEQDMYMLARVADFVGFIPSADQSIQKMEFGTAYLHYTTGEKKLKCEYFITHRDERLHQRKCFGLILQIGHYPRLDYIDLYELIRGGARLDWNWGPIPIEDILEKLRSKNQD